MLDFQPTDKEIFILAVSTGLQNRCIFTNLELTESEQTYWDAYLAWQKETYPEDSKPPSSFCNQERKLLRFLQAHHWVNQKVYDDYHIFLDWESKLPNLNELRPDVIKVLNSGAMYTLGRDKWYRPIIHFNINVVKNIVPDEQARIDLTDAVEVFLTHLLKNHMLPSKVEQWCIIIDLDGCGWTELPVRATSGFMGAAQRNFRGRNWRSYVLNSGFVIRNSYGAFSYCMDEFTGQKVELLGNDYKTFLPTVSDADQLEQRFGGQLPNKTECFWPPENLNKGESMTMAEGLEKLGVTID